MKKIKIFDTTLRDGGQMQGINLSVLDKINIAKKLIDFGIDYIEGGWPGANEKDTSFFQEAKKINWKKTKLVAFGSTRKKDIRAQDDKLLQELVKSKPDTFCIFGKAWDRHIINSLGCSLEENLKMISDTIKFLKKTGKEVFFDAEHFFDGFKANPEYAITVLKTAENATANYLVLCDTNGGMLPSEIEKIIGEVKKQIKSPLGIHCHNDSDCAVANSLVAIENGVELVQSTINGYGERCGNANLVSIIPNVILKDGFNISAKNNLNELRQLSDFVAETCNIAPNQEQAFVGDFAFTHKAGVHAQAMIKDPGSYEHIDPKLVGNKTNLVVSDQAGKTSIINRAKDLGFKISNEDAKEVLREVARLTNQGYQFEVADGSFAILVMKQIKRYRPLFEFLDFNVDIQKDENKTVSEATVKINLGGEKIIATDEGDGPVNALDKTLRKALNGFYPGLNKIELIDYKVRVLQSKQGTSSKVVVTIQQTDGKSTWGTVGVSENIIEASWQALVDGIEYGILKH